MLSTLPKNDVVLLGIGHTNAHILRMWRMHPIPNARLTCISNHLTATYSGMLPGALAGLYSPEQMQIDLVRLCASAGARLIQGEVIGLDATEGRLEFRDRPPLAFDVLSIGIGSVPCSDTIQIDGEAAMSIKPMQTFLARLDERLDRLDRSESGKTIEAIVIGSGVAGVEVALALRARHRLRFGKRPLHVTLVDTHDSVGHGLPNKTRHILRGLLDARDIQTRLGSAACRISDREVELASGETIEADLTLLATSATAPPILSKLGLPTDEKGFLLTERSLASKGHTSIFAVGDSGTIEQVPTPKAGVYAVRQGPVLWQNIQHQLKGEPLEDYIPQKGFLKLLSTGDGQAVMNYKGLTFHGSWCWQLKNRIDTRFMDKYQDYTPVPMSNMKDATGSNSHESEAMRCTGCGSKVGGSVLARVLDRLDIPSDPDVLVGLNAPDDAAVLKLDQTDAVALTVDFFSPPLDDLYLSGRIAAQNAVSDLYAMGARPTAALAICMIPVGPSRQQEELLHEFLAGSLREFRQLGVTLVGGHTTEGPKTAIGFSMIGQLSAQAARTKGSLREGDVLILTKPLGTGILLAAHMRAACRAEWMSPLVHNMLQSNQSAAEIADKKKASGMTDITGFGLAGHLLEILRASRLSAELRLDEIPLLPGTTELTRDGIESTLAPDNRLTEKEIQAKEPDRHLPQYAALFDPQTSGGLLFGVPESDVEETLESLAAAGYTDAVVIGTATKSHDGYSQIVVH